MWNYMSEDEFVRHFDALADALFRHCFFRVFDREAAKDLVQETFLRAWDYLAKGQRVDNMPAFLYRVATNLIIDESRKKKTRSLEGLQDQGFDVREDHHLEIYKSAELRDDVGRALRVLKELDPKHREVVVLRYINELDPKEIAEIIGETENAVSVRLHRAIKKLRALLT
ncbi:MAG: RNA polymerase sigma factor [Patescibacteria group bacterium]